MLKNSLLISLLCLCVLVSSSPQPQQKQSDSCGCHPNEAIATLSLKRDDGSYEKICSIIVVKNNVAIGNDCDVEEYDAENLFVSPVSLENRYLTVRKVRFDTVSTMQYFNFENEQQLKKVCLNAKDSISSATELFSLKLCPLKNLVGLTPKSYLLNAKDANQICKYDVNQKVITAKCKEDVICTDRQFYGFAKIDGSWNMVEYNFEYGALARISKSEETFEATRMEQLIEYMFGELTQRANSMSDQEIQRYFESLTKEIKQNVANITQDFDNYVDLVQKKAKEYQMGDKSQKKMSDSDVSFFIDSLRANADANSDIKLGHTIMMNQAPNRIKNANLNCKVTHGPDRNQEVKLACKLIN
jgi:hypothetical protein